MPIQRIGLQRGAVGPERLAEGLYKERYCFETFGQEPSCTKKGALVEVAGTDAQENIIDTGRYRFEFVYVGDATDAFRPTLGSEGGYNWVFTTATLDRGCEINWGGLVAGHPRNFVATSEDWFTRCLFIVEDASGVDIFHGVRKVAANAATMTDYADVAGIRIVGDSSSTAGAYSVVGYDTDYTATALTLAGLEDATAVELEVQFRGGVARYFINGIEYSYGLGSFTADSGDRFSPISRLIQTTDLSTQIKTLCYEAGPLEARQEGSLLSLAFATT